MWRWWRATARPAARILRGAVARQGECRTAVHTLSRDAHARMRLTVEVRTVADIQRVLFHLMEVKGVLEARRV